MTDKNIENVDIVEDLVEEAEQPSLPPMGFEVIRREFMRDKIAMTALCILVGILIFIFVVPLFMEIDAAQKVDIFNRYLPPGEAGHILGTDDGGRDVLAQLIVGARNSIVIGWSITIITSIIGIVTGIVSGYYGGMVDDVMMRIVDFIMILPTLVIVIVVVTIVRRIDVWTLVIVLSAFNWPNKTRLFRTQTLSEGAKDYISASKTMGTRDWKIMFLELMPNLSSIIITNLTLSFAANIGIETGLSFLGFGLPSGTPSLGTLIGAARTPDVIENKAWVWLPAVILVLVMMLSVNYIGQALQRAADSKQRLG